MYLNASPLKKAVLLYIYFAMIYVILHTKMQKKNLHEESNNYQTECCCCTSGLLLSDCNTPKNVGLLVKNCQASRVSVILSATSVLISSLSSLLWKESQTEERSWRKGSS